ncbi:unnamed protein product [Rodentolepis nana]|uniref:KH domain-containing protein n=1 Tax=Rodentolepis nana TaxID=102285 RepID=A0A0R3T8G7_RODNA|nr:unnamed protein product [Rodentolepis nana]
MYCKIDVELIGQFGESYPGYLTGYKGPDTFVFKFVGDACLNSKSELEVSPSQIRLPPNGFQHVFQGCDVSVGDYVEVLAGKPSQWESVDNFLLKPCDPPMSWWPARVIKKGGELIVVEYSEIEAAIDSSKSTKPSLESGLFINQVRPRSTRNHLSASDFHFTLLEIPGEFVELFKDPSNIEHITRTCGPSMLLCEADGNIALPSTFSRTSKIDGQHVTFLAIFTSDKAKLKAETIFPDIPEVLRRKHLILNQISQIKEMAIEKKPDLFYEEFRVEKELLGHSIGAHGTNIKRARSIDGIASLTLDPGTGIFKVSGKTQESIDSAKRILDFATDTVEVPENYVGRVIGFNNNQIQSLVDHIGLAKIRISAPDASSKSVFFTVTGTRTAINDAKVLISFMLDNLKEIDELEAQVSPTNGLNGGFNYRNRRNNYTKSRAPHTNSKQIISSGLDASSCPGGELNGNQSDGTVIRRSKLRQRKNQNPAGNSINGTNQSTSISRQISLPSELVPKPNEVSQKQDAEELAGAASSSISSPKLNERSKRGKGGHANKKVSQQPTAAPEHVPS